MHLQIKSVTLAKAQQLWDNPHSNSGLAEGTLHPLTTR
jgi:hypothetical protein